MVRKARKRTAQVRKETGLRSGYERRVKDSLESAGIEHTYEEDCLPYTLPETIHKYTPDFKLILPGNKVMYVESKGIFSAKDRKKMLLVIQQHPDKDIRLLFMENNKLNRASKTRYTDWCEQKGIRCAVSRSGAIPLEWLE